MLRDIETRQVQAAPQPSPVKPVYQDLRPAPRPVSAARLPRLLLSATAVVALLAIAFYAWNRSALSVAPEALAPVPVPVAQPASNRVSRVSQPSAPTEIAASKPVDVPAPAPVSQPQMVAAAAAPAQPIAAPADKVGPASDSKFETAALSPNVAPLAAQEQTPTPVVSMQPEPTLTPSPKPVAPTKRIKTNASEGALATPQTGSIDKRVRPLTSEETAESAYRQAVRSLEQGRNGDAGRQLQQALAADAQHVGARELSVAVALKNGRMREAQQLLEEGTRLSPKHYPFVLLLARIHIEQGADARALALLEQAASIGANDADHHSLLAALYQRQGRHADAVAAYRRAVEIRPDDARAWVGLGISQEVEKERDGARHSYQRARDLGNLPPALARHTSQRLAQLTN